MLNVGEAGMYLISGPRYLYYHGKRGQWQIHHKIGNYASCRLKTKRAVHVVGRASQGVFQLSQKEADSPAVDFDRKFMERHRNDDV